MARRQTDDNATAWRRVTEAAEELAAALPALDLGADLAGDEARTNLTRALNILRFYLAREDSAPRPPRPGRAAIE